MEKKNTIASKYMIVGAAGAGKSYALKGLQNAFVIYADTKKRFPLKIPHTNVYAYNEFVTISNGKRINNLPNKAIEYKGMTQFKKDLIDKITTYHKLKGKLPETIAFDAITNIYKMINDYIKKTTKNVFGSHSADTARDLDDFLAWIERTFISKGINIVFLAHSISNQESGEPQVATSGSKTFENTGGFMGACNYVSYIHVQDGERLIAHKDLEYASVCRSMLVDIEEFESALDFNIQDMITKIKEFENSANEDQI